MERLLIIDGNCLLFQMFYGMPSKIYNRSGNTIHATIGFISYVMKQIETYDVTRAVVVFDGDASDERKAELPEYKSNRPSNWDELPANEVPFNEEKYIKACLDFLSIKVIDSVKMEADDVIASLTKLFDNDSKVIISSFDSDFFQLINENVSVLRYRGKASQMFDSATFAEKFGFPPDKYVFYKSLVGDKSDNIRGVDGVGKVTAAKIVAHADSLDNFDKLCISEKIKSSLVGSRELVERNLRLITLGYKSNIKYSIDDFSFNFARMQMTNSQILSKCGVFD